MFEKDFAARVHEGEDIKKGNRIAGLIVAAWFGFALGVAAKVYSNEPVAVPHNADAISTSQY